jgi:hypothetical protein
VVLTNKTFKYYYMKDDRDNTVEKRKYDALKRMYEASCSGDEYAAMRFQKSQEDYESTIPWEGMGT